MHGLSCRMTTCGKFKQAFRGHATGPGLLGGLGCGCRPTRIGDGDTDAWCQYSVRHVGNRRGCRSDHCHQAPRLARMARRLDMASTRDLAQSACTGSVTAGFTCEETPRCAARSETENIDDRHCANAQRVAHYLYSIRPAGRPRARRHPYSSTPIVSGNFPKVRKKARSQASRRRMSSRRTRRKTCTG